MVHILSIDELAKASTLLDALRRSKSVCILTGAGISAESGIPTFRGQDGLWKNYRAEDLASPEGFQKNPALVWEWYTMRREIIQKNKPNPGHFAIAQMEDVFPECFLITQNVDGYHRDAGSTQLIEIHGNIWHVRCTKETKIWEDRTIYEEFPIYCCCGALARPHILWFGETYDQRLLSKAFASAMDCDLFLIIGTSGMIWTAAGLLREIPPQAISIEFNLEPSELTPNVDYFIKGPSGKILPKFLEHITHE